MSSKSIKSFCLQTFLIFFNMFPLCFELSILHYFSLGAFTFVNIQFFQNCLKWGLHARRSLCVGWLTPTTYIQLAGAGSINLGFQYTHWSWTWNRFIRMFRRMRECPSVPKSNSEYIKKDSKCLDRPFFIKSKNADLKIFHQKKSCEWTF